MTHETDPHGPPASAPAEDKIAGRLAIAQFGVSVLLLGGLATFAYVTGMRMSAAGGGHAAAPAAQAPAATVDVKALLQPTPEAVAKGKTLYTVNCGSCHGVAGAGDGPAAVALNPKPRNFVQPTWRYGGGVARIVQTITVGSPGTAMAAFSTLPLEDRFALAHFVRSLGSKPEEDKPADLAWLGPVGGAPGAAAPTQPVKSGPTIPIERALQLLAEAPPEPGQAAVAVVTDPPRGAALYAGRCAECHGGVGEGGVRVRMLGSAPYVYLTTPGLGSARTDWASNPATFRDLVLRGIPGYVMPANGDLSRSDLEDLYQYARTLHAQQRGTGRSRS